MSIVCVCVPVNKNVCLCACTATSIVDCKLIFPHPSWYWDTLLKICVFIFAFIMPVLIITVCYGLMILRLKSVRMLSGSQVRKYLVPNISCNECIFWVCIWLCQIPGIRLKWDFYYTSISELSSPQNDYLSSSIWIMIQDEICLELVNIGAFIALKRSN